MTVCTYCHGNDRDMPCAYPSEGKPGCLRDARLLTSNLHTCPDCRNQFVQSFVCTTCGAQKLYDETVRSQAVTIERLRAALETIGAPSPPNALLDSLAAYNVARAALSGDSSAPEFNQVPQGRPVSNSPSSPVETSTLQGLQSWGISPHLPVCSLVITFATVDDAIAAREKIGARFGFPMPGSAQETGPKCRYCAAGVPVEIERENNNWRFHTTGTGTHPCTAENGRRTE